MLIVIIKCPVSVGFTAYAFFFFLEVLIFRIVDLQYHIFYFIKMRLLQQVLIFTSG